MMLSDTLKLWFQSPEWLWALWALAGVAAFDIWRGALASKRGVFAMILRVLMLATLIFAAASPVLEQSKPSLDVIFVVDVSKSVEDAALQEAAQKIDAWRDELPGDVDAGLVVFHNEARVVAYPSKAWTSTPSSWRRAETEEGTHLEEGLTTAMSLIREGSAGRLVLLSDGRKTRGELAFAINRASQKGVRVDVVPLETAREEVLMSQIELTPREVLPGETIEALVSLLGGSVEKKLSLIMELDGEVVASQEILVKADASQQEVLKYAVKADIKGGEHDVRVYLAEVTSGERPASDVPAEALSERATSLLVRETANILIVTSKMAEVEPLARALEAEGLTPIVMLTEALYDDEKRPDLEEMDLVVLGNVPAKMKVLPAGIVPMPDSFIRELRTYVSDGGGLVVLGGNLAYDLGNYGGTELRKVLPVELEPEDSEIHQPVTMIIILDRSGSMGQMVDGTTKMDLTNRGAVAAMKLLRPYDNIGVMSVDERVHWNVPVQPAKVTSRMTQQVRSIYADGGGIFCYTALVEAWDALKRVDTPLKHVILFSDAMDAEEQVQGVMIGWGSGPNSYDLAQDMVRDGITVSVIGVGSNYDVDTPFLRNLARHGKGRFHISANARRLEALFVEETTQLLQLKLKEKNFRPSVKKEKHASLREVGMATAPRLRGYVKLEAKPTAEVVLSGPEDDPIMVTWQYGLGQVTAMATDAGPRWSGNWLDWKGYPKFWTQLVRWSLKREEGRSTGVQVEERDGVPVIEILRRTNLDTSIDERGGVRGLIREVGSDETAWRDAEVRIAEPGRFVASPRLEPGTSYEFGLVDARGEALLNHRFATMASAEQKHALPDTALLEEMASKTGGELLDGSSSLRASILASKRGARFEEHVLWLWFAIAALLLLVTDAFMRRALREEV